MNDTNSKHLHPGIGLLLALTLCLILSACVTAPTSGGKTTGPATPTPGQNQAGTGPGTTQPPVAAGKPLGSGPVVLAVPLSGKLALAGQAIRAGFEAADGRGSTSRRAIVVDSSLMQAQAIVAAARAKHAALLVGPLSKDKVSALAQLAPRLPVLALNQLDGMTAPPAFYRYALAPEDDARTAAEHATARGWRNALVLVPLGDWGNRILRAFRKALDKQGGKVVASARFDPHIVNHKMAVRSVLGPYHSGTPVDFVFIAARPVHARMLRSQLRFYHAATLPVIGTSDIYDGVPEPRKDTDLNGVAFTALPWVVSTNPRIQTQRKDAAQHGSTATKRFPRLYAMGRDTWRLIAEWIRNGLQAGTKLPGLTGELEVMPNGRIRRHLAWAQFSNGHVRLLQPANQGAVMATSPGWSPSAPAATPQTGSTASLKAQIHTNTDGISHFQPVTRTQPADSGTSEQGATTPARNSTVDYDSGRRERASEVSRLIDMAAPESSAAPDDSSAQTGTATNSNAADKAGASQPAAQPADGQSPI